MVIALQTAAGAGAASLIAIPLFIFAGELMLRGGISDRLISFAASLVGRLRGGLGQVNVLSSLFFGGVSGSAIADVSAIGGTMIPQMVSRGYGRDFAVNVSITAALVALLVPPSHNLILFSASAGGSISIADLFAAGIVPALLLTLALMATVSVIARRRGYASEGFPGFGEVARRLVAALPGLLLVMLIFVGIRAGIFTAIESASIAVCYALLVTGLLYRKLSRSVFLHAVTGAARTASLILFVIASAASFGWLLAYLQVPTAAVDALTAIADSRIAVLLLMVADPARARHVHGPRAADHHLHADLPAGGEGLRRRSGAFRHHPDHDRRYRPGHAAGRFGAVRRLRDRQDQRHRGTALDLAVLHRFTDGPAARGAVSAALAVAAARAQALSGCAGKPATRR